MLIFSMTASADGFVTDRDGGIGWTAPDPELFAFHLSRVGGISAHLCGRRLYEIMRIWETDPSFPDSDDEREFAAVWTALPKVVFSRTLESVEGNARLAAGSLAEEIADLDGDAEIGGAELAAQAIELGLVDEFHLFRAPIILGGGTPFFPPVGAPVPLELAETRTFGSGVVFERWARA